MALSGSRLNTQLYNDYLTQLQTQFPAPAGLLPAESAQFTTYQQKLAHAFADLGGTDIVSEITANADVSAGIVSNGTVVGGVANNSPVQVVSVIHTVGVA